MANMVKALILPLEMRILHGTLALFMAFFLVSCFDEPQATSTSAPSLVSPVSPTLSFAGATSVAAVDATTLQVTWTLSTDPTVYAYRVYTVNNDGSLNVVATLPATATQFLHFGLPTGVLIRYVVRAIDVQQLSDSNLHIVTGLPYSGITSTNVLSASTVQLGVSPAIGADSVQIFCKQSAQNYPVLPTSTLPPNATTANLTGLPSGRTHTCFAAPSLNGVLMLNANAVSFQTKSQNLNIYRGPLLVTAYGPAPTANIPPTAQQVRITWLGYGNVPTTAFSYQLLRTAKGGSFVNPAATCTAALTTSCVVCSASGVGAQTCLDTNVGVAPSAYDYMVLPQSTDGFGFEEPPVNADASYRITAEIPPANMVLVHRDSANYEQCQLQGKVADPLNHQRCAIFGASMLGAVPYNSGSSLNANALNLPTTFYDLGYNFFVDRWEAACNWTSAAAGGKCGAGGITGDCFGSSFPASNQGLEGQVYYLTSSAACYVRQSGVWYQGLNGTLTSANLLGSYTVQPSPTMRRPPYLHVDQNAATAICSTYVDPNYGAKRLMRQREYLAAAAWPHLTGEPNALSDVQIVSLETGGGHTPGNYSCNTDSHAGITFSGFNTNELAADSDAVASDFVIGSTATSQCISRFGLQDAVGNAGEWLTDQMFCSSSGVSTPYSVAAHSCIGIASSVDPGTGFAPGFDFNGVAFDGFQGPSSYNFATIASATGGAGNFNTALGIPLISGDNGNALSVTNFSLSLHNNVFDLNTDEFPSSARGLWAGGDWSFGGRWASAWQTPPTFSFNYTGFRCALPIP